MTKRNVVDRLDAIEKQLDDVRAVLRHNNLKGPPTGESVIHDWPEEEIVVKWVEEGDAEHQQILDEIAREDND